MSKRTWQEAVRESDAGKMKPGEVERVLENGVDAPELAPAILLPKSEDE